MTNREQLIQEIKQAPDDIVQKTLDFFNQININQKETKRGAHPFEEFIGMISDDEAAEMISAIKSDCRQVDPSEW